MATIVKTPGVLNDWSAAVCASTSRSNRKRHALRLVFDTAALLSVPVATSILLLLYPASAHAQGGVPLWTNRCPAGDARAIAVDSRGNVLVTGASYVSPGNDDWATIKYSNAGVPLWTNRYHGPANGQDWPSASAVDSNGNVFVTGFSHGLGTGADCTTIAYSNSGVPLWTNYYNGPGNSSDWAAAIAVDSNGNVFVTGASHSGSDDISRDYATIAYSNAGVPLWTNRYDGANGLDEAFAIAVDSSGNVFVTGGSGPGSATIAYSSAGVLLWTNRINGCYLSKMVVDTSGNLFVTGSSENGTNSFDYVTIKYSSSIAPPRLDFQLLSNQLLLSWTNAGFTLQSATAVPGPFTNIPAATSPYTNRLTGPQHFFRLISN